MIRLPLAVPLESRDGDAQIGDNYASDSRDGRIQNGIVEVNGEGTAVVRKRPGLVNLGQIRSGGGQLLHNWNGIRAVVDDYIHSGTLATIISGPSATALSPTNADLQMSAANTGSGAATPRMMIKNRTQAWTMSRSGAISAVTYGGTMGSETYAVVSLSRVSTTATATIASDVPFIAGDTVTIAGATGGTAADYNIAATVLTVTPGEYAAERVIPITITRTSTTATATTVSGAHGLTTGTAYTIAGANDSAYNGSKTITSTGTDTFTYTVTVTPAGTATLNPSDKSANLTLSGGDLTATTSVAGYFAARCTISKTVGKWYWEVTVVAVGDGVQVGVEKSTHTLESFVGSAAGGWGYNSTSGAYSNGVGLGPWAATYTTADVIGVALDMDSGTLAFYKNGALQGTLSGITGTIFPALSCGQFATATANFGATAFAHTIPSGFAALASDAPVSPASGTITITDPAVSTPATFTYAIASGNDTATGTITAQGSGGTVPGIAYINGYFVVMDTAGTIWNSASDDPTTWGALDFLVAQNDSSRGTGIAASRGYLVAFKEWSTELFYDAGNATGSPFSPVASAITQVGCATGWSIASIDDKTFFLSQTKAKGRGVHVLSGLESRKVSTPDIDRILDDNELATVYAYCLKIDGHSLYVLTLAPASVTTSTDLSGVTLVYDAETELWYDWNTATLGHSESATSTTATSITRSGNTATITFGSLGGYNVDGNWIRVSGASQSEYNGLKQVMGPPGQTSATYIVEGLPLTPATTASSITSTYTNGRRFPFVGAISFGGAVLLLHESTGKLYSLDDAVLTDDGNGIEFVVRTRKVDGGTLGLKKLASVSVVGNRVNDVAMIRWSDDDYDTSSAFRPVDLSSDEPQIRRCGSFRRRSIELKHVGNTAPIFEALELDIK